MKSAFCRFCYSKFWDERGGAGICGHCDDVLERAMQPAQDAHQLMMSALRQIAEHPHCSYEHLPPATNITERQYQIGIADGHRCAAEIAKAILSKLSPENE